MRENSDIAPMVTQRWDAGSADGIVDGGRLVVDAGSRTVGIFRVDGRLYAYENVCRHQGGPVCQGVMVHRVIEVLDGDQTAHGLAFDESEPHIVCPWHGYEYSIKTGIHPGAEDIRLTAVLVEEVDGCVYFYI